jgi:hypothetical protein
MGRLGVTFVVLLLANFFVALAAAEKRVALVIGNGKYQNEAPLPNPANDAREVAAALTHIKFDDVAIVLDGDLIVMQSSLAQFARKADGADLRSSTIRATASRSTAGTI